MLSFWFKHPLICLGIVFVVMGLAILVLFASVGHGLEKSAEAFARIERFDSKERVIALMGAPDRIAEPNGKPMYWNSEGSAPANGIVEVYWFMHGINNYWIGFDRDGKAAASGFETSP